MVDPKKIEKLKQEGWESMEPLLDHHLPVMKTWYVPDWLGYAATTALIIGVAAIYPWKNDPRIETTFSDPETLQTELEIPTIETPASTDPFMSSDTNLFTETGASAKIFPESSGTPTVIPPISTDKSSLTDLKMESSETMENFPDPAVHQNITTGESEINLTPSVDRIPALSSVTVKSLPEIVSPILIPDREFVYSGDPVPLRERKEEKKFQVTVLAKTLWTPKDHFAIFQAGPGIKRILGNWSFDLSAGVAIPLNGYGPFEYGNNSVSTRYFYAESYQDKMFDYNAGLGAIVQKPSLEKFTTGWGLGIGGGISYRILPRWDVSLEAGYLRYNYDMEISNTPSQYPSGSVRITGLVSNLFFTGLKAGYNITDHFSVQGGMALLNPLSDRNTSGMISIAVQYGF